METKEKEFAGCESANSQIEGNGSSNKNYSEGVAQTETVVNNEDDGSETIGVDELVNFYRDDDPSSLIGKRWLCKGKMAVIQGPTGVGKSSLIMQWSIRLILGLAFFGIQPVRAIKVLIIQAENDRGDMAEAFQDTCDAMGLEDADLEMRVPI